MPRDFSLREMHGGASFPAIGNGAVLGTGVGGLVQPIELTVSRHLHFFQTVPAIEWSFDFSPMEMKPLVVIKDTQGQTITDSVNFSVTFSNVLVWTEGVLLAGQVDLYWFGQGGPNSPIITDGGGEVPTEPTPNWEEIDGGIY